MKKQTHFALLNFLILQTALIARQSQTFSPADILENYGKAVVRLVVEKAGDRVGLGNGFLVSSEGIIITNHHVIKGSYPMFVQMMNGDIYEDISVIDFNERQDIAVIKIKGFDLPFVKLGNSNDVREGERIIIIGKPNDSGNTISDGLLTHILDTGEGYSLHRLSVPLSTDSCGSPVFNERGEVIGIATRSDELGKDMSYSIPINYARGIVDGPMKYALREFASRGSEFTSKVKQTDHGNAALILEQLNNNIVTLFFSLDQIANGCYGTSEASKQGTIRAKQYRIDPAIYSAGQSLNNLRNDLSKVNYDDSSLQSMRVALLKATTASLGSLDKIQKALEKRTVKPDIFGTTRNYPSPDWARALAEVKEIDAIISSDIDKRFISGFVERMRMENPGIESALIPYFCEVYDNRNKNQEQLVAEDRNQGHLGTMIWKSSRIPIVLYVEKSGPADEARIRRGDTFIGVDDNIVFNTQMDLRSFLKATKPGESFTFKISRGRQIIKTKVTLN